MVDSWQRFITGDASLLVGALNGLAQSAGVAGGVIEAALGAAAAGQAGEGGFGPLDPVMQEAIAGIKELVQDLRRVHINFPFGSIDAPVAFALQYYPVEEVKKHAVVFYQMHEPLPKTTAGVKAALGGELDPKRLFVFNAHLLAYAIGRQQPQPKSRRHVLKSEIFLNEAVDKRKELDKALHELSTMFGMAVHRYRLIPPKGRMFVNGVFGDIGHSQHKHIVEQVAKADKELQVTILKGETVMTTGGKGGLQVRIEVTCVFSTSSGRCISITWYGPHPSRFHIGDGTGGGIDMSRSFVKMDSIFSCARAIIVGYHPRSSPTVVTYYRDLVLARGTKEGLSWTNPQLLDNIDDALEIAKSLFPGRKGSDEAVILVTQALIAPSWPGHAAERSDRFYKGYKDMYDNRK